MAVNFIIDPEIRDYMPACDEKTDAELERQLIEYGGARDPIVIWQEEGIVIDGNRRYQACKRLKLPFQHVFMRFEDRAAVFHWMDRVALGRRNLSPEQQAIRIARMCDYEREKNGSKNAARRVAEETGVSERTVHRSNAYVRALDNLPEEFRAKIVSGEIAASQPDVIELAKLPPMHQTTLLHNIETGAVKSLHKALFGESTKTLDGQTTDTVSVDEPEVHDDLEDDDYEDDDDGPDDDPPPPAVAAVPSYGQCPNCAGTKWLVRPSGVTCAKCKHPHGEPTGGVDEGRIATQRAKTVKTVEALIRAFDDLNLLSARPKEHAHAIATCKILLNQAKGWQEQLKEAV